MGFLSDMALYSNFMHHGLGVVGTGEFGSAFRVHDGQNSGQGFAGFSAGVFEWELLRRWAADHGHLSADDFAVANPLQMNLYGQFLGKFPELGTFMRIDGRHRGERFLDADFNAALDLAYNTIAVRAVARTCSGATIARSAAGANP